MVTGLALNLATELPSWSVVNIAAPILASGFQYVYENFSPNSQIQTRYNDNDIVYLSGSESDFSSNSLTYKWKLEGQPKYYFKFVVAHNYGSYGFQGTTTAVVDKWQPPVTAHRRLVVTKVVYE